jgi:hypothetical protein
MTLPRVEIIVLNWNGRSDTLECLGSLMRVDYPNFKVILVDNGSTDGSIEAIRREFPQVELINNGTNLGFAEGNNRGIARALKAGAEFILLLNNDTIVDPGILSAFHHATETMPGGIYGAKIYFYDEKDTLWYAGGVWDSQALSFMKRGVGLVDNGQFDTIIETDWVVGCAMFIRSDVFRNVGLLEPKFFLNNEEIDFCSRARRRGFSCVFVPEAILWHKVSVSFGGPNSPMKEYFSARNRLLWASRNARLSLRIRIYAGAMRSLMRRFILPLLEFRPHSQFSAKRWWWGTRAAFLNPHNRAYFRGVSDFCLRRFGDCPDVIRELTKQWALKQAKDPPPLVRPQQH